MRAKSGQIVCERQKGETTGARATVISFAKMTTYQSNQHKPPPCCLLPSLSGAKLAHSDFKGSFCLEHSAMGARAAQAELLWGSLTEDVPSESSLL